jgi:hypothetical protein
VKGCLWYGGAAAWLSASEVLVPGAGAGGVQVWARLHIIPDAGYVEQVVLHQVLVQLLLCFLTLGCCMLMGWQCTQQASCCARDADWQQGAQLAAAG